MNKVKDYNDFLIGLIFENVTQRGNGVSELPFVISDKLRKMLQSINHTISTRILELDKSRKEEKVTFVDLDEEKDNYFSLVNSNKVYDNILKQYGDQIKDLDKEKTVKSMVTTTPGPDTYLQDFWFKNRASIRIGAFINKVFPKEFVSGGNPGEDIESFVQTIIAKRSSSNNRFKLVSNDDIVNYYNYNMYDSRNENGDSIGTLATSCMRHSSCSDYIEFYAQNDVKLLILFSDREGFEDKIVGRALVWELSYPSGRTFMDRIYYRYETDMTLFKEYAEKEGWLYKKNQNSSNIADIVDPMNKDFSDSKTLRTLKTFHPASTHQYPYMDTLKWFYVNSNYLTNKEPSSHDETIYFLEDTGGGYTDVEDENDDRIYIEYYGEYFDEDEVTYCELGDDYRTNDDAIYISNLGRYATERYVERHLNWSDYEDTYLEQDDSIWSEYHNDYITNDNSIPMAEGADNDSIDDVKESYDVRHNDEIGHSVIEYEKDGDTYYFDKNDYGDYFVNINLSNDSWNTAYKHIIWDKDKLFKYKGKWYYEYDSSMKDELFGQKRIDFND